MDCKKVCDNLSLYADGGCEPEMKIEISRHLDGCESCRNELENINSIIAKAGEICEVPVPSGLHDDIMRAVRASGSIEKPSGSTLKERISMPKVTYNWQSWGFRRYAFTGAAACLLLAAFAFMVRPMPYGAGQSAGYRDYFNAGMAKNSKEVMEYAAEAPAAVPAESPMAAPAPAPAAPVMDAQMAEDEMYDMAAEMAPAGGTSGGLTPPMDGDAAEANSQLTALATAEEARIAGNASSAEATAATAAVEQKIIKTANYDIHVKSFDEFVRSVESLALSSNGFIENFSSSVYTTFFDEVTQTEKDLKSGYICLKIPARGYEAAKLKLDSMGKILSVNESIDNITSQYVDMSARLEVKKAEEQRLLDLLAKAEEIDDLIALETRLTYVRSDIESMQTTLKGWDRSVKYSTLNISITEVEDNTYVRPIDPTLGEKIKEGLNRSVNTFVYNIERLVITVAESSVAIIVFAIFAVVLYIIFRLTKNKRRKDDEKNI